MNADQLLALYDRVAEVPDAIVRLRRFVLDLAVRGKLVEQDPADEPASELLRRISAEKGCNPPTRSQKQLRPNEPLDQGTTTAIPNNWEWSSLADLSLRLHYGYTASANPKLTAVRLLRITDIQNNRVNWDTVPGCMIDKKSLLGYVLEVGDILIARTGGTIGKTFLVSDAPVTSVFASYLIRVQPVRSLFDRYLKVFCESDFYWDQLREGSRGGGQPNVNGQTLGKMSVPLPPIAEQHRIVSKVDELMALCDQLEAARTAREAKRDRLTTASLTRLTAPDTDAGTFRSHARFALYALPPLTTRPDQIKQLRQTILNLAVRGKLVEQNSADEPASELLKDLARGFANLVNEGKLNKPKPVKPLGDNDFLFPLPHGWVLARFNQIASIQSNLVDPKHFKGMPHIAPDNIESWTARLLPYVSVGEAGVFSSKHLFSAGAILYSKIRPNLAKVTKVDFEGLCSADMYPIHSLIDRDFLVNFMITQDFVQQAVSEDNRVAMPKINQVALSDILVPIPPLTEQHRIVAKVDALMVLCDRLDTSLTTADTTRRRLLEALLHEALEPAADALEAAE